MTNVNASSRVDCSLAILSRLRSQNWETKNSWPRLGQIKYTRWANQLIKHVAWFAAGYVGEAVVYCGAWMLTSRRSLRRSLTSPLFARDGCRQAHGITLF